MMPADDHGSFLIAMHSFLQKNPGLASGLGWAAIGLCTFVLYRQVSAVIRAEIANARALEQAKESYRASIEQENEDMEVFQTLLAEHAHAMSEQADKSRELLALARRPSAEAGLPRFFSPVSSLPEHAAEGLVELIEQYPTLSCLSDARREEIDEVLTRRHDHRETVFRYAEQLFGKTHEEIESLVKANTALRQQHVAMGVLKRN